jgi:hypothetical protein
MGHGNVRVRNKQLREEEVGGEEGRGGREGSR